MLTQLGSTRRAVLGGALAICLTIALTASCVAAPADTTGAGGGAGRTAGAAADVTTTLPSAAGSIIIDHRHTHLADVPLEWIDAAKSKLHIAYGHTSHGSQIVTGMTGLSTFANAPHGAANYAWNNGGRGGALDLADTPFSGAADLGNPDFVAWEKATRKYLDDRANADVNVVMWSWCGEVSYASEANITTYLTLMSGLERDYPDVRFIYMTGHTDGSGLTGRLHIRNQQIRDYCEANGRILYDFEDIESYDPDGAYFGNRRVRDTCAYDGGNWAVEWQDSHRQGVDWFECESAHSEPLNANLKAYAAWWLWARLAGWDGGLSQPPTVASFTPSAGPVGTAVTVTGTGFGAVASVTFHGVPASFTVAGDTRLTATCPVGATSGPIAVTTAAGTGTSAAVFTVVTPTVTPTVTLDLAGLTNGVAKLGRPVTARGSVTPASLAGGKVLLTAQWRNGSRWVTVRTSARTIDAAGSYSWTYKPAKRGAYRVRAAIAATGEHSAAGTRWCAFRVR